MAEIKVPIQINLPDDWVEQIVNRLKNDPQAEWVEIIRCGECKYYKIDHPKANGYHCCYRCHNIFPMKETDFCSKAERRTDDKTNKGSSC